MAEYIGKLLTENTIKRNTFSFKLSYWIGVVILFIVAYVHIALFMRMMSFRLLPILFLLNGVGALVAMIGVLMNSRIVGWVFGIVMSGGAALAKIAMNTSPAFRALLTGMPSGMKPKSMSTGGTASHILPLFTDIQTLATISIIIELVFVLIAIIPLLLMKKAAK